ncbi:MAG TPA: tetratricopeptide repeat protein, partial [Verrucomicrobiae bacterium]
SAIQPLQYVPFSSRVANALTTCTTYVYQTVWPAHLAVFYPYSAKHLQSTAVIAAFVALVVVSLLCFAYRRSRPYLLAGWLWYLIMLIPVIGLVQVGNQAHADRYMYLPQIGLCLMLAWLLADLIRQFRIHRLSLITGAVVALSGLFADAFIQTTYWRNSETLWTRAIACTGNNSTAQNNLGFALAQKGQMNDAVGHFQKAIEIDPDYVEAYNNLGDVYFFNHQRDEAIGCFQKAAQLAPDNEEVQHNLGLAFAQKGQLDDAIAHFQKAVSLNPEDATAQHDLSIALAQKAQAGAR